LHRERNNNSYVIDLIKQRFFYLDLFSSESPIFT